MKLTVPTPPALTPLLPKYTGLPTMQTTSRRQGPGKGQATLGVTVPAINSIPTTVFTSKVPVTGTLAPLSKSMIMPLAPGVPPEQDEDQEFDAVPGSEPVAVAGATAPAPDVGGSLLDAPILESVSAGLDRLKELTLPRLTGASAWLTSQPAGPWTVALALGAGVACVVALSSVVSLVSNIVLIGAVVLAVLALRK